MGIRFVLLLSCLITTINSSSASEIYSKNGSKLNLYGKFYSMHYLSSEHIQRGAQSSIVYGLRAESKINDQITGFFGWENGEKLFFNTNQSIQGNSTYLGFVGVKFANTGSSIDYGRNYSVLHDLYTWINVMPELSGNRIISDDLLSGKAGGTLTYRNKNFFNRVPGLSFAMQFQEQNDNNPNENNRSFQESNRKGYGFSLIYRLGNGVSSGVAMIRSNWDSSKNSPQKSILYQERNKAEAYAFSVKYDKNKHYLAALYRNIHNITPYTNHLKELIIAEKARDLELLTKYRLDCGIHPHLGYLHTRIDSTRPNSHKKEHDIKQYVSLGANYIINKNMTAFIDYRINLLPTKDNLARGLRISNANVSAIGISYVF